MKHYYCSIFSKAYAYKGVLLYESLCRWDRDFHFFLVCLDEEVRALYNRMQFQNATVISLAEVENWDPQLARVRNDRNDKEYIWTAKASTMLYILANHDIGHIVWLDGDTCFYSDPSPIFREWGNYSIMLTEERWRPANRDRIYTKGRYNTGFMGFKQDANALEALRWFRKRLLEWCYDRLEGGLWSDQLYVNDWLQRFNNVGVIRHPGVNVGPYIIRGCTVTREGDYIYVNGKRLVFYHSYGFRYYDGNEFDLCSYIMSFSQRVVDWIYLPYIIACREVMARIEKIMPGFYRAERPRYQFIRNYYNLEVNAASRNFRHLCTIISRDYLIQGLALYNSVKRGSTPFRLWVLAMDDETYNLLAKLALPEVIVISLHNIRNEKLEVIQGQRQFHEFCWTLKPYLVKYIFKNNKLDSLLYLDADLYFFQDLAEIYREWGQSPIFITRLWMGKKWAGKVGNYSAGLIGFRRGRQSMKVLEWWRKKCREWCYDKAEAGLWADQKYLDQWPKMLGSVKISQHKGINLGPWNIRQGTVVVREGAIYFRDRPLVCYHFSGFRVIAHNELELCNRRVLPAKVAPIYSEYTEEIARCMAWVSKVAPDYRYNIHEKPSRGYNRRILSGEAYGWT